MVELLIVAMLLALLASIIVPQFASTTNETSEAALRASLERIRAAIELYKVQHGRYPGEQRSMGNVCVGGKPGTGDRGSEAAVVEQLILYSRANGRVCTLPVGGGGLLFPFGPYLQSTSFPANPITGSSSIVVVGLGSDQAGSLSLAADGAGGGWKYDPTSGRLIANDASEDSRGVPFEQY